MAKVEAQSTDIDMTPMIDMVFLLIIFFILAGRITSERRSEQITVPPTRTAQKIITGSEDERIVINVFGTTKSGSPPRNSIRVGTTTFLANGLEDLSAYQRLRQLLDRAYDKADKRPDPKNPALQIPYKTIVEIRADADTEYRVVQEVLQVVSDSVNPFDLMKPKEATPDQMKPFVAINYTTRLPGEK